VLRLEKIPVAIRSSGVSPVGVSECRVSHGFRVSGAGQALPPIHAGSSVGDDTWGMTLSLSELARALLCSLDEVRAWVRILEYFEVVGRDARGKRTLRQVQVDRIIAARILVSSRGWSKRKSLESLLQLETSVDANAQLGTVRQALGLDRLETRILSLEQKAGV
jgi:hypothetical protein